MATSIRVEKWSKADSPSEQEAEAILSKEGYQVFRWYDVGGTNYPKHRHSHDECLWILSGEMKLSIDGVDYHLKAGDRLYLPAKTAHTAETLTPRGVTYLVGQKP